MSKGACRERAEEQKPLLKPQSSQSCKTEAQKDCSLHPVPGWTRVGPGHRPSPLPAALLRPTAPSQLESLYLRLTFQECPPTPRPRGRGRVCGPQAPWGGRGKEVLADPRSARFSHSEKDADRRCGEGKPPVTTPQPGERERGASPEGTSWPQGGIPSARSA